MVKEFLSQKGVEFEERDVSLNRAYARELVESTGQMGVPVTIIDGQAVIGFDRGRLEQILSQAQRPSFGAAVADAAGRTAGAGSGALIGRVRPGSPAERMGLAAGDIIVELNTQVIKGADDLQNALARLGQGSRISVVFIRERMRRAAEGRL